MSLVPRETRMRAIYADFQRTLRRSSELEDWVAEREGFEPSVPVAQYARLAIWCLRPLGHLSARVGEAIV